MSAKTLLTGRALIPAQGFSFPCHAAHIGAWIYNLSVSDQSGILMPLMAGWLGA